MVELLVLLLAPALSQPEDGAELRPPFAGYELVWRDEFEGDTLDPAKWSPWALGPRRDALNIPDAVSLDGMGHLLLTTTRVEAPAVEEGAGGEAPPVTLLRTGGVWTKGLFEPTFGYIEARIRMQRQIGHWGAFWLNCSGMGEPVGDPATAGAEIDIVEFHHRMRGGEAVQHNIHWDGYGETHKSRGRELNVQGLTEGFHTYGLLWTPEEYVFFVDGVETWRIRGKNLAVISHRPEYLILSLEVGKWAGDISEAELPDSLMVDWVRVWQLVPDAGAVHEATPAKDDPAGAAAGGG